MEFAGFTRELARCRAAARLLPGCRAFAVVAGLPLGCRVEVRTSSQVVGLSVKARRVGRQARLVGSASEARRVFT